MFCSLAPPIEAFLRKYMACARRATRMRCAHDRPKSRKNQHKIRRKCGTTFSRSHPVGFNDISSLRPTRSPQLLKISQNGIPDRRRLLIQIVALHGVPPFTGALLKGRYSPKFTSARSTRALVCDRQPLSAPAPVSVDSGEDIVANVRRIGAPCIKGPTD
jgi:hypothetical protein